MFRLIALSTMITSVIFSSLGQSQSVQRAPQNPPAYIMRLQNQIFLQGPGVTVIYFQEINGNRVRTTVTVPYATSENNYSYVDLIIANGQPVYFDMIDDNRGRLFRVRGFNYGMVGVQPPTMGNTVIVPITP